MKFTAGLIEFDNSVIEDVLSSPWQLESVLCEYDLENAKLSVFIDQNVMSASGVTVYDFKSAVYSNRTLPIIIRFDFDWEQDLFGLNNPEFDDSLSCKLDESHYQGGNVQMIFDVLNRGKELNIGNSNSTATERKPLFWSSILE